MYSVSISLLCTPKLNEIISGERAHVVYFGPFTNTNYGKYEK